MLCYASLCHFVWSFAILQFYYDIVCYVTLRYDTLITMETGVVLCLDFLLDHRDSREILYGASLISLGCCHPPPPLHIYLFPLSFSTSLLHVDQILQKISLSLRSSSPSLHIFTALVFQLSSSASLSLFSLSPGQWVKSREQDSHEAPNLSMGGWMGRRLAGWACICIDEFMDGWGKVCAQTTCSEMQGATLRLKRHEVEIIGWCINSCIVRGREGVCVRVCMWERERCREKEEMCWIISNESERWKMVNKVTEE